MKCILFIAFTFHCAMPLFCQEIPVNTQQQLENNADTDEGATEDDTYLLELEHFKKDPLNLNTAEAEELRQLYILTDLQINNLITYRRLFGKLVNIYELQAVPSWDVGTIRKVLPFVTVASGLSMEDAKKRFSQGEHSILLRVSQGFEKTADNTKYLGSPQRVLFRYRYTYKNLLQFGITADKDAGEQFFGGAQKHGFDFYSFHLFARKIGIVKSLALGDFTVNMGQGLIQWQSLAFKKSIEVMAVKRQSAVLRPYSSAGEFYFNRGAGLTIQKEKIEATVFASSRKLNANVAIDTVSHEDFISSFLTSGYNRTISETGDRNKLLQLSFGGNIIYRGNNWHVGINGVAYRFSLPLQKRDEPYNLYAINGKKWHNGSIDYSYTYRNFHFFGEAAADINFNKAFINGLLISLDPRVDMSIVYRNINKAYQAVNGNAFTENTYPANEKGCYAGIAIRPAAGWRIDAYADVYKFPWIKYRVDGPSHGRDYAIQFTFTPHKELEIYSRYKNESKQSNYTYPGNESTTNMLAFLPKQSWRTQIGYKLNKALTVRNRAEILWYNSKDRDIRETGFFIFLDLLYKPLKTNWSVVGRLQYFETSGYNSRIYAYENDVAYSYSIPAFSDKGYRYYIILQKDAGKNLSFWVRWAGLIYNNNRDMISLPAQSGKNGKTELKLQGFFTF